MEIKKQDVVEKIEYPEKMAVDMKKYHKMPIFSVMLVSLLSNSNAFGASISIIISDELQLDGGIKVNPYYAYPFISYGQWVALAVAIIALVTTIINAVRFNKFKKNRNAIENIEEALDSEVINQKLKRMKKILIIHGFVFLISTVVFIILAIIFQQF